MQKRLLDTSKLDKDDTIQTHKNPLEVSEDFVQRYNSATADEKTSMMDTAHKMLLRSKVFFIIHSSVVSNRNVK